jgi:uncharacterized protein (TIGR02646 family)
MIKIEKNLNAVPASLIPAYIDLFPGHARIPSKCRTTHEKRMSVINIGAYNDTPPFNDRYKLDDIRSRLIEIYNGKCAFCEQKVEQYHVEHYRPKAIYYWLAFSWDNLMLSCPTCNQYKRMNFEIAGTPVSFINNEINLRNINNSSSSYDSVELPKMVNPEITDASGEIRFQVNGIIESVNVRFAYTIEKCRIDRKDLNDNRRSLLARFREHLRDVAIAYDNDQDKKIAIETTIRNFVIDSKNLKIEFLAFRRYAILSGWLNDIVKEIY